MTTIKVYAIRTSLLLFIYLLVAFFLFLDVLWVINDIIVTKLSCLFKRLFVFVFVVHNIFVCVGEIFHFLRKLSVY